MLNDEARGRGAIDRQMLGRHVCSSVRFNKSLCPELCTFDVGSVQARAGELIQWHARGGTQEMENGRWMQEGVSCLRLSRGDCAN